MALTNAAVPMISSWGWDAQADLNTKLVTENNFHWMQPIEDPGDPSFGGEMVDQAGAPTSVPGTIRPPIVDNRHGTTFTHRYQLTSQASAYDASSDVPSMATEASDPPLSYLIYNVLGGEVDNDYSAKAGAFAAAGSDANTWELGAGPPVTPVPGGFWAFGNATTAAQCINLVKTWAAGTTVEMLFDGPDTPAADSSDYLLPMVTAYTVVGHKPTPLTWVRVSTASTDDLFIGTLCTAMRFSLDAGKSIIVDMEWMSTHFDQSTNFSQHESTAYLAVPPVSGVNGAWAHIGGAQTADGSWTAADYTCAIYDFQLSVVPKLHWTKCHGAGGTTGHGYGEVLCVGWDIEWTMGLPWSDDWVTSNQATLDYWIEQQTPRSIALMVGNTPGRMAAFCSPAAVLSAFPQRTTLEDGLLGYTSTWRASVYTGETASGAGGSALRVGLG